MKKRIVCVLLTLIMLLSLVPMGASAASHKTSEAAITVLKQMTTLKTKCYYYSGSEFRTGYGTVCTEKHSFKTDGTPDLTKPAEMVGGKLVKYHDHEITEQKADAALRKALEALDKKVCAFETANGLSLKQHQHDALVVFSYNAGTGWMDGNGVIKSVIINKGTANEMLNAMAKWTNNADLSRREVEVNMYINGVYSNTAPSNYGYVIYDPKGGSMPQQDYDRINAQYTFHYDLYKEVNHPVTPTRAGYRFLGWYRDSSTGGWAWVPKLNVRCDGKTMVALWQDGQSPVAVSYQLHENSLASKKGYQQVGDKKSNADLTEDLDDYLDDHDDLIWIDYDYIDSDGNRWSHVQSVGCWVKVGPATTNETTTDSNGTVIATATVTANGYLNLRKEAGTDSEIVGALAKNDTVDIYEIKTVNGHQWGRSKSGWLCLTYARVILKDDVSISDAGAQIYGFTGKMKKAVPARVEAGENTNAAQYVVPHNTDPEGDSYKADLVIPNGTSVTLTNLFVVKGETWAKATWKNSEWKWKSDKAKDGKKDIKVTRSGWVNLDDVEMDPVTYTVVANSVNVRDGWGDSAKQIFTLNKGVQVKVNRVALVGENVWGRVKVKRDAHIGQDEIIDETIDGYVNLASKYFSRNDAPVIEKEDTLGDKVATVVGTDSLRVRKTSATYAQQIGRLTRGTTVAIWEYDDGWYKVDSNKNGVYDEKEDGWCYEQYLEISNKKAANSTVTDASGNKYTTDGTGKGIVANTYGGLNVRQGAGTNYAPVGKLLPGTIVEILETARSGKWGRTSQGWVSMDYITMVSYNEVQPELPAGTTAVDSYDKAQKTTTTAVYTGKMNENAVIYRTPTKDQKNAEEIRTAFAGENVTIYELAKVTESVTSDATDVVGADGKVTTTTTTTSTTTYWARINDGWVENPETSIALNALDEKIHTQTDAETLKVRKGYDEWNANDEGSVFDALAQGDQVAVTALDIIKDKVWGRVDTEEGTGWIRLDYMSEGAVVVKTPVKQNTTTNQVVLGQGSTTGGFVTNTSGYRYTGKVIRANSLNVRANPSETASKVISLTNGQAMVIYETTTVNGMAWGRCDAGWVYLYYVDLTPVTGAVDARVVANENTIIYSDMNCTSVAGSYSKQAVVDIYEIVGKMARTDQGWVSTDNLL